MSYAVPKIDQFSPSFPEKIPFTSTYTIPDAMNFNHDVILRDDHSEENALP